MGVYLGFLVFYPAVKLPDRIPPVPETIAAPFTAGVVAPLVGGTGTVPENVRVAVNVYVPAIVGVKLSRICPITPVLEPAGIVMLVVSEATAAPGPLNMSIFTVTVMLNADGLSAFILKVCVLPALMDDLEMTPRPENSGLGCTMTKWDTVKVLVGV